MHKPIYVIGSANTDMVVMTKALPMPGETVIGGTFFMNPGGKGANQAVAASRLGGQVTFVAKVGRDLFGEQMLQQFQREKINTTFVLQDHEHPSGIALIGVDAHGENTIIVAPGSNRHLSVDDVKTALTSIRESAIILIQLEIPIETVEFAITYGKQIGCDVILNPAPVQPIDGKVMEQLYLITPNESEAEMLTGISITNFSAAEQAAIHLFRSGIKNVVITLGAKGAYLYSASFNKLIPAPAVTAVDTTAGGDCFNGALAVALASELALDKAVEFACTAASISVTRIGAQSSMPYKHEVSTL